MNYKVLISSTACQLIQDPTIEGTYLREFLNQLQIEVPDLEVSTESETE